MRTILAFDDLNKPKILARYRGKAAKEVYRCSKGIFMTKSLIGPISYATAQVPGAMFKGYFFSSVKNVGLQGLTYLFGIGWLKGSYELVTNNSLKNGFRIVLNLASLPMTGSAFIIGHVYDSFGISALEEAWFGSPVYLFNDNRIWLESNFTQSIIEDTIS
nr:hypothetical protein [Haslea silbo]